MTTNQYWPLDVKPDSTRTVYEVTFSMIEHSGAQGIDDALTGYFVRKADAIAYAQRMQADKMQVWTWNSVPGRRYEGRPFLHVEDGVMTYGVRVWLYDTGKEPAKDMTFEWNIKNAK